MPDDPPACANLPPLAGWRVGITAHRRADEQAELLSRRGAIVTRAPVVRTLPFGDDQPLQDATRAIIAQPPDLVIATTGIGMRSWFGAAESWGLDQELLAALRPARIAARGPKARAALAVCGLSSDIDEPTEQLSRLIERLRADGLTGRRVALQLYGEDIPWALDRLAAADVVSVPVYRWTRPDDLGPARKLLADVLTRRLDAVTFTSAAAVRSLCELAEQDGTEAGLRQALSSTVLAACVGPVTEAAAAAAGFDRRCAPERGRLGLLTRQLSDHLHRRHQHLSVDDRDVVRQGAVVLSEHTHVELTTTEALALDVLAQRPGAVVSRRTLRQRAWAPTTADSAIDSAVSRLRNALGPVGLPIDSIPRRGWALRARPDPVPCPRAVAVGRPTVGV